MKSLRNSLLCFGILFLTLSAFGQERESLINVPAFKFDGFGSMEFKFTDLVDNNATYFGLKGGTVINNTLGLGINGGAYITHTNFNGIGGDGTANADLSVLMGYTGIFAEYIMFSEKKIHFSVPVSVGPGVVGVFEDNIAESGLEDKDMIEFSPFLAIEPAINIEVNIVPDIKFILGAGYRIIGGSDLARLDNSDLSGFNINLGLRIGSY